MWSLTSPRADRISGPENFVRQPEKTFSTVSANNEVADLFNHFVGAPEQPGHNLNAKRLGHFC